jgi:hypothetical protein
MSYNEREEGLYLREVPMTDLEVEIDTLRELDTLRVESGGLRDEGVKVLTALLEQGDHKKCNPLEFSQVSMAPWELSSDPPKELKKRLRELGSLEIKKIVEEPMPILLAAGVVQALAAVPGFVEVFSKL